MLFSFSEFNQTTHANFSRTTSQIAEANRTKNQKESIQLSQRNSQKLRKRSAPVLSLFVSSPSKPLRSTPFSSALAEMDVNSKADISNRGTSQNFLYPHYRYDWPSPAMDAAAEAEAELPQSASGIVHADSATAMSNNQGVYPDYFVDWPSAAEEAKAEAESELPSSVADHFRGAQDDAAQGEELYPDYASDWPTLATGGAKAPAAERTL